MAEFVYGITEHVDRIEGLVDLDRPSLCLVDFDERDEHIKLVALLRTLERIERHALGIDERLSLRRFGRLQHLCGCCR